MSRQVEHVELKLTDLHGVAFVHGVVYTATVQGRVGRTSPEVLQGKSVRHHPHGPHFFELGESSRVVFVTVRDEHGRNLLELDPITGHLKLL